MQEDDEESQYMNFKTLKEARKYFFIKLLESILADMELYYQSINSRKSMEFQMLYVYFINTYL